jgi:hypothetical protein
MSQENQESGASEEEQQQVRDVVHGFYELLPYNEVNEFDHTKASEEELAEFKSIIDEAQNVFEQVESMRIPTGKEFTAEELNDDEAFPYRKLQRIAKSRGISAAQNRAMLVADLTGVPKSVPAIARYPRLVERLALARRNAGNYQHPRQAAARQNR